MENDIAQIRSGMVNYIGALINASIDDPKISKHKISSILLEEVLKLAKDNDVYDFYILKPLFRANIIIFKNKIEAINKDLEVLPDNLSKSLKEKQKNYIFLVQMMKKLLDDLDKNI